jgi:hypothetical protein
MIKSDSNLLTPRREKAYTGNLEADVGMSDDMKSPRPLMCLNVLCRVRDDAV